MKVKIYITIVLFLICSSLFSQTEKDRVFVAYVNNFAKYTEWPNQTKLDSFRVAVITQNQGLKKEFANFSKNRVIHGKPLSLQFITPNKLSLNYQIIILSKEEIGLVNQIIKLIKGKPVLLVTEEFSDKRQVMINLYQTSDNKLEFEVNKANVVYQGLKIDPEMLLAGGTEIDVAKLFRESQQSMAKLEQSVNSMRDSLEELNKKVNSSRSLIQKQEDELAKYDNLLKKRSLEADSLESIYKQQIDYIESQMLSIEQKNEILDNQGSKISEQWQELNEQNKLLQRKQNQIDYLNNQIENKNDVLGTQLEQIKRQRRILILIISITVLIAVLIIMVLVSYRNNRRKSELLEEQNHEIEDKFREVKQLNEKLQRADQYKSIFLASMSHELRTPLNSIIGYTGIILMGMTGDLNEEQNKQLEKVKNNAKHLLSLINDILDISKIEADKVELSTEEFKLTDVTKEVIDAVTPLANQKNIKILNNINKYLVLNTDKRRLKQVILNIASNAVKYSESGSVNFKTELLSDDYFRLSVIDTGIGISDEEQERLFQPFQQIDTSLTRKNSGTGLGLYLCRKLMKLLGGSINVNSTMGEGSEFYIEMPLKIENTNQ